MPGEREAPAPESLRAQDRVRQGGAHEPAGDRQERAEQEADGEAEAPRAERRDRVRLRATARVTLGVALLSADGLAVLVGRRALAATLLLLQARDRPAAKAAVVVQHQTASPLARASC